MLGAFADRVNAGAGRLQAIVDQDAASDLEACVAGELVRGPDADGDHDELRRKHAPVGEPHRLRPASPCTSAVSASIDAQALRSMAADEGGGARVELALHEAVHDVHEGDGDAPPGEAVGRLQPEQAAADHDGARARLRSLRIAPRRKGRGR